MVCDYWNAFAATVLVSKKVNSFIKTFYYKIIVIKQDISDHEQLSLPNNHQIEVNFIIENIYFKVIIIKRCI